MPIFDPVHDPGSNFPELLRRVGLGTSAIAAGGELIVPHATTCVALTYADGVVMAGDRRATAGNLISHRSMEKVVQADHYSGVAIAGAAGPAMEMIRLFQLQLEHYEKVEGSLAEPRGQGEPAVDDGSRQPPGGDAGHGRRPPVRRIRRTARCRTAVRLRRDGRAVRRARLHRHRLGQPARRHRHQGRLPHRHVARRRRSSSPVVRCGRRPMPTRRPAAPICCVASIRPSPR